LQTSPPRRGGFPETGNVEVVDLDLSQYNQLAARFEEERQEDVSFLKFGIATKNAQFNRTIEEIEQVALRSQTPILLTGPTGAGKSFLARRIYELKKAKHQLQGEFIDVNCATLRGDGAMSALFGHLKGSFTGALQARAGYLKAADHGLLFLDEIGELGLDEQAMLLKAIEEKRFFPMGSDREVASDFQLIAGTHRDLAVDVKSGRFREDLFARINTWLYSLPGLKDRREDIEPNLDFELERIANQLSKKIRFNSDAKKAYLQYAMAGTTQWTGNFRDLSASLLRMATLADAGRIDMEAVAMEVARLQQRNQHHLAGDMVKTAQLDHPEWLRLKADIDPFDLVQLEYVIQICRSAHNLSDAGRALFEQSRKEKKMANDADRLRKYLAKFDLSFAQVNAW
jgi:transcriptional regulatory protein RtcR